MPRTDLDLIFQSLHALRHEVSDLRTDANRGTKLMLPNIESVKRD